MGLLVFSFSSSADDICPSGTVGLCDPAVIETVVESVETTTQNDGAGVLTTTVTTTVTTTDTVINSDSGDILASGSGYVSSSKEGDMDSDWGGQGPASMPTGSTCGNLGTDKCAQITGSGNSTSTMGVAGMGTTFIQTVDVQNLNIEKGGKTTYSIKVDKQDSSDSIYLHITGKDGSTVKFAGTDVLSAAGVNSGYAQYTGGFDFADGLTTLIVEVGGRDINLAIGPVFDDVTINLLFNVVSQIVQQTITTVEQYVYLNNDATQEEINIVEDIFENNTPIEQPDGGFDLEPIDDGGMEETSYESVELELDLEIDFEMDFEMPDMDIEMDFEMPDMTMEAPVTMVDVEMEMDMMPPPVEVDTNVEPDVEVEKIEVASVETEPEPVETTSEPEPEPEPGPEPEPEPEPEPVEEVKEEVEEVKEEPKEEVEEVKEEPKEEVEEVKEEPKEEVKEEPKKEIKKVKTDKQKKADKQKAGSKIVKKMGDKGRYESVNQLKTLIVMNVIGNSKSFFENQQQLQDTPGFFSDIVVPDGKLSDNNMAAYLMVVGSSQKMNSLIELQYE